MNPKRQELEARIADMEADLGGLKARLRALEEQEQHEAIDNLDQYLQAMDHKWDNLREFWGLVLDELRARFAAGGPRRPDGS